MTLRRHPCHGISPESRGVLRVRMPISTFPATCHYLNSYSVRPYPATRKKQCQTVCGQKGLLLRNALLLLCLWLQVCSGRKVTGSDIPNALDFATQMVYKCSIMSAEFGGADKSGPQTVLCIQPCARWCYMA